MKALLLVGSPRGSRSTSASLGTYLLDRLQERNFQTQTLLIQSSLRKDKTGKDMLSAVNDADLIVLAFPLYVDCLPAATIKAMELIAEHRRSAKTSRKQRFTAISNCGFPEAAHNDVALSICRRFAKESGFNWAGGIGIGQGEAIGGQPMSKVRGMARNTIKALDLAADTLAENNDVPQQAIEHAARPFIPASLYTMVGSISFKKQARKNGLRKKDMYVQPYLRNLNE